MADKHTPEPTISFKDTLNLPRTDFPIRPNAQEDDPAMVTRWTTQELYEKAFMLNKGKRTFILHDGPPYANGNIHIGHAYNKILKDIVTKSQRMFGNQVPVMPGWDCHGLPIEHKVTQEYKDADRATIVDECRKYAAHWINVQRQEFKRLGVVMNWDHPYLTMDYDYEASVLQAFSEFVAQGYIERKNKTVPWCASCKTVLAAAEIEHKERKDPSIYVLFPISQSTVKTILPTLQKPVYAAVWTTTPWTLPLNRAVLLKPGATYTVLEIDNKYVMVAQSLVQNLCNLLAIEPVVIAEISADSFIKSGATAQHPCIAGMTVPFIADESVLLTDGTAFVHCAPGVGPEDYEVGIRNKLEIYSPVSESGTYTAEIQPQELVGMPVADGQIWVIKKLAETGMLLFKTTLRHSYPHCWRCHNGLIFRATKQWFCDLSHNNLKIRALEATQNIKAVPEKSINRLQATLEGRLEWCLSRQRVWGVPIPALICNQCDYTYTSPEFIAQIAQGVAQSGIEYWQKISLQEIMPAGLVCTTCNKSDFKKETDILDVWFESGVSHYAVLRRKPELSFPADMYLEGSDQHRAWFQSSLLTSIALSNMPSMKEIVTHGFVVDKNGHKMSKSVGNVITPQEIIDKIGTDGLRLWASSLEVTGDAVVSPVLLQNVQEVYRKIRNTCRFLLSNLYDFSYEQDAVRFDQLRAIDQFALYELTRLNYQILEAYAAYDFTSLFHHLGTYCSVHLSAFYLDIVKDRLYVEAATNHERRSAQTSCFIILDTLTHLLAPVLSFTAEQISDHYQKNKSESIHLQSFIDMKPVLQELYKQYGSKSPALGDITGSFYEVPTMPEIQQTLNSLHQYHNQWEQIAQVRSGLLKAIEVQREQGLIKHSLEARLHIFIDEESEVGHALKELKKYLNGSHESLAAFIKELVIVSQVEISQIQAGLASTTIPGLFVQVTKALGEKCPRCWQWTEHPQAHNLCERCADIVKV
jgi:isoleucyl-tRNA synthetase